MNIKPVYRIVVVAVIVFATPAFSLADQLYWTENTDSGFGLVRSASLDGTGAQTLVSHSPQSKPINIAVDSTNGTMYWADNATDQIYRSTLSGQNVQSIITLSGPTPGLSEGYGLAVDPINQKLYFTAESHDNKIFRANLDGSNVQTVLTLSGQNPAALALDLVHHKIYFSTLDTFPQRNILSVNLDGSGPVNTLIAGLVTPGGLAVDPLGGKLYYTDATSGTISRSNLDGTGQQTLVSQSGFPWGIALDLSAGTMYWAEANGHLLKSANLDGSNVQSVFAVNNSAPFGIAIASIPEPSSLALGILAGLPLLAFGLKQSTRRSLK